MHDRPETTRFLWRRLPHWEVARGRYFVTIRLAGAIPEAGEARIRELSDELHHALANGQAALRLRRAIFREMEGWLDRAGAANYLADGRVAGMIAEAIRRRERDSTWQVFDWVIMPSHMHLFVRLGAATGSEQTETRLSTPLGGPGVSRPSTPLGGLGCTVGAAHPPAGGPGVSRPSTPLGGLGCTVGAAHWRGEPISSGLITLDSVLRPFKHWTAREAIRMLRLRTRHFWQRDWFDHWSRSPAEDERISVYIRSNPVKAGLVADWRDWPHASWSE